MNSTTTLESLLESANWDAVVEAQREGPLALPAVRLYAHSSNYRSRQIATACAARIGGTEATEILASGLADSNINVQLTAARELSSGAFPVAATQILEALADARQDVVVREPLSLAAGYIPGDRTLAILHPLAEGGGTLATNARMALARLGDAKARAQLKNDLSSAVPRTRYETLDHLRYVGDLNLIPSVKKLLDDREHARRIGTARHPRFRRVCDQAVDTTVFLLHLPFPAAPEKIYTDQELARVRELAR